MYVIPPAIVPSKQIAQPGALLEVLPTGRVSLATILQTCCQRAWNAAVAHSTWYLHVMQDTLQNEA